MENININDDGTIDLISEMPTEGTVNLRGYQGYNNAVKLLNDACSSLYGNEEKGITARSIKIEDIEEKIDKEELAEIQSRKTPNSIANYGMQIQNAYSGFKTYPKIYKNERLSVIDGVKNTSGLSISQQTDFIENDGENIITANQNIQPYQTYYNTISEDRTKNIFKGEGTGNSNLNYNLIIVDNTTEYWIASRYIDNVSQGCYFAVGRIAEGFLRAFYLSYSGSDISTSEASVSVRPIVKVRKELLDKNLEGIYNIEL